MEAIIIIPDLSNILSYQCPFSTDIKYKYWVVNIHFDNYYYLVFYVSKIWQIQPICMSQGARTSCFIFSQLMIIVFGSILFPQLKPSLLHGKTAKDFISLVFYINDIFKAFKTYQKQYIFLYDNFFPRMVWSRLKLILWKQKIKMIKIFALEKEHEIGKKIRLKPDKIKKIFTWPIP